jgi:hypothetical protein
MASPQNPTFSAQPPQKKGCGIWTFLGVGCLVVVLICAGIIGGGTYWVKQNVTITEAPAEVTATASQVADIEPPEGFKPTFGMSFKIPFYGDMKMAAWTNADEPHSMLFVMQIPGINQQDPEAALAEAKKQMEQSGQRQGQDEFISTEKKAEKVTVRGKPATLSIARGHFKSAPDKPYVQSLLLFEGKAGTGFLMMAVPGGDDGWTDDDIKEFVESIK